jgi:hypothetical protein
LKVGVSEHSREDYNCGTERRGEWEKGLQIHNTHPLVIKTLLLVGGTAQHAGIQIPTDNEGRERGATMGGCKPDKGEGHLQETKNFQCHFTTPDNSTTVQPIFTPHKSKIHESQPGEGAKK